MIKLKCINDFPSTWGGNYIELPVESPNELLKLNEVYTINYIDESGWFDRIYVNEIPNFWFSREAFENF